MRKVWICYVGIMIMYLCTWHPYRTSAGITIVPFFRYFIDFLIITSISFLGYRGLSDYSWAKNTWGLIYTTAILFLVCLGLIDFYTGGLTPNLKSLTISLYNFFCSPVPFGAFFLLIYYSETKTPHSK